MSSIPKTHTEPSPPAPAPAASSEPSAKPAAGNQAKKPRRRVLLAIVAVAVLAGIVFGVKTIVFYRHHAETDDAQVEGHIAPVLPKVPGYVTAVMVDDNQKVAAGQVVVRIDDRDLRSKVATAEADYQNAKAAVEVARANVASARTLGTRASADLRRYAVLRQKEEVSQQQYDAAKATADSEAAQVEGTARSVAAAQAKVAQKQADLDFAKLQLSYAVVSAPETGIVSRKSVEVGQFVQAGQPLLAIVSDVQPWVVANFKETQLKKMRIGQPVSIEVDAYPKFEFHGKVDSIAAATGAKFALLPPDNATGNFTKVVQRVPVKIVFTDPPDPLRPLRAGMSVNAIVATD
jgi:membrane fusion protein (multidrug efflux system)